jgi:formamidopyrimidine-DNA glycosylase
MPELPEVETVKEKLKPRLLNKKINMVTAYWPNILANKTVIEFENDIKNQYILDIKRRGKWLIFELTSNYLLVHLRMEGKFFFKSKKESKEKHEHIIFELDDTTLRFNDVRKFGKMYLLDKDDIYSKRPLNELGLEPFDSSLDIDYLKTKYLKKNKPIKEVLLDQKIVAGIGNIYADEILFLSNINPLKKANKLSDRELSNIIVNTKKILESAIKMGGTTIRSYVSLDDKKGMFQGELNVHRREGLECHICGSLVIKIKVGGRGTYYCPTCQK